MKNIPQLNNAINLLYNSVPVQQLRTPNSLQITDWNNYINQIRVQTNEMTTYLKQLEVTLNEWKNIINGNQSSFETSINESFNDFITTVTADINTINNNIASIQESINCSGIYEGKTTLKEVLLHMKALIEEL